MFVGEAPGADEDLQGEPFVGKAGQLLTKIIQAMGYSRDDVYIANILKCRPDMPPGSTGNRKPKPEEMQTCIPWLEQQIALVKPKAMVALGATAVEGLLGSNGPVSKMRGKWFDFHGIPVMATYHPAYLLRNQLISEKRKVGGHAAGAGAPGAADLGEAAAVFHSVGLRADSINLSPILRRGSLGRSVLYVFVATAGIFPPPSFLSKEKGRTFLPALFC